MPGYFTIIYDDCASPADIQRTRALFPEAAVGHTDLFPRRGERNNLAQRKLHLVNIQIRRATEPADMAAVRMLFRAYADSLDFDLGFQEFETELANLPGAYALPAGCLLLATVDGEPAGCVALRPLAGGHCEMKRLFVPPQHRGLHLGNTLAVRIIEEARQLDYQSIRLDTIPASMGSDVALYQSLGFQPIEPYCANPIPGAEFLELRLK